MSRTSPAIPSKTRDAEGSMRIMPNGTITACLDRGAGEVRLYCEPEPDEHDWAEALRYVRSESDGQPPDEFCEAETVVLVFRVAGETLAPDTTRGAKRGERAGEHAGRGRLRSLPLAARPGYERDALRRVPLA
jgi:hypothetical protein